MSAAGVRIFDEVVNNTAKEFYGMPAGEGAAIACDGDVKVEWWIPAKNDYDGTGETISAPGGEIPICPHNRARLTTTTSVAIGIVKKSAK